MRPPAEWLRALPPLLALLALPAQADPVADGLTYLMQHQDASGAFVGDAEESAEVGTSEALTTLRLLGLGQQPAATSAELSFSLRAPFADGELELRRLAALSPTPWSLPSEHHTTHAASFEEPDAHHLALSLALRQPTAPGAASEAIALQLAGKARANGCYGVADNADSIELTGQALQALRAFPHLPFVPAAMAGATSCLLAAQRPGGSFGGAADTAAAVLALMETSATPSGAVAAGRAALASMQSANGSFGGSIRVTARAVRALGFSGPDWRVPSELGRALLTLSPSDPLQGMPVAASLTVENRSSFAAPAIPLRFVARPLAGGPEVTLLTVTVPALASGESTEVSGALPTGALAGAYQVRALVDPDGYVSELDEANNEAWAKMSVRIEHDLSISLGGIHFSPGQVSVDVKNLGAVLPLSVPVRVYAGNPSSGTLLGSALVAAGLATNAVATLTVPWHAAVSTPTPVYVKVDPDDVLKEASEQNNQAFRYFYPDSEATADLSLSAMTFSPAPVTGQPFTVGVVLTNPSARAVSEIPVALYLGTELRGRTTVENVVASGTRTVSFAGQLVGTSPVTFTAKIEPSQVSDPNAANDQVTLQTPFPTSGVELSLSNLTVGASPASATVSVVNSGQLGSEVELTATDLSTGQPLASADVRVPQAVGGAPSSVWVTLSFPAPPEDHVLRFCATPADPASELNPNDNCLERPFGDAAQTDLQVSSSDLSFNPVGADVGELVHASTAVHNASTLAASAVVEWWQGRPSYAGSKRVGTSPIQVPASSTVTATLEWIREEGAPELHVRIAQVTPRDSNPANNVAGRHLFLESVASLGITAGASSGIEVRVARVTGRPQPELVVGYQTTQVTGPGSVELTSGVALLERTSSGKYDVLWKRTGLSLVSDVVVADLDADGTPEVAFYSQTESHGGRLSVYRPNGDLKWERDFPHAAPCGGENLLTDHHGLGLGDVDGDGVADLVVSESSRFLHVVRGDTGATLSGFPLTLSSTTYCHAETDFVVLDVDGNGTHELIGRNKAELLLISRQGEVQWRRPLGAGGRFALVDLDGDASPEMVFPTEQGPLFALDARTGAPVQTGSPFASLSSTPVSFGAVRQDGLTYAGVTNNAFRPQTAVFGPDLLSRWITSVPVQNNASDVLFGSMADLVGKGRPQLITYSALRAFVLQDGRNGDFLLGLPSDLPNTGNALVNRFNFRHPAVVAGLSEAPHASIAIGISSEARQSTPPLEVPLYGPGEVAIYTSSHWTPQPKVWASRTMRHDQLDESLRVGNDYRWWTTHNTWNQQFLSAPATLAADLWVASLQASSSALKAGEPVALTANVFNIGGLAASAAKVTFFDGDPKAGGKRLGDVALTGVVPATPRLLAGTLPAAATLQVPRLSEGRHELYAVVNQDEAVLESGRENNQATVTLFVRAPTTACDLAVDAASIAATPASPLIGETVRLTATIRNAGGSACDATTVALYDGVPGNGGLLLGTADIDALDASAAIVVQVDTLAQPGTHLLRWWVDEAASTLDVDRTNNVAGFTLFAPEATQPDLSIASLTTSPPQARPGEPVLVSVVVLNSGSPANPSTVALLVGGVPAGSAAVPLLGAGESATLRFALTAPAQSVALQARADAAGGIVELDESNNVRSGELQVSSATLSLTAAVTPSAAAPDSTVTVQLSAQNSGASALAAALHVSVEDGAGATVATLSAGATAFLPGNATTVLPFSWNTGRLAPGLYHLRATAFSDGRYLSGASAALTVLAEEAAATAVVTDKGSYRPGEDVLMSLRLTNTSRNTSLEGATLRVEVKSPSGAVLFSSVRSLATLPAGGRLDTADLFPLASTLSPGSYTTHAEVRSATQSVLATSSATWAIAYQPAQVITGVLSIPNPFALGPALAARVTLTNHGAVALSQAQVHVLVLDAATLQQESAGVTPVSLLANESAQVTVSLPTTGLSDGQKLFIAQLGTQGQVASQRKTLDRQLAIGHAQVDNEPPVLTVSGVSDEQLTRETVTPVIEVSDMSSVVLHATLDGQPFESGTPVSSEGDHLLSVTATDAYGNSAQRLVRFTLDKTPPVLSLSGVAPQAILGAPVTLSFSASDLHPGVTTATLDGAPIPSGKTVSAEGEHLWVVSSVDAAGNAQTSSRTFTLDFTAPQLTLSGVADGSILQHPVTLTFSATDNHGPSTVATLDGAAIQSGHQVTTEGTHTWLVKSVDLAGNQAQVARTFTLDFTPPQLQLEGVASGAKLNRPVTLTYRALDAHLASVVATLDGVAFASGATVSSEGNHLVALSAVDQAGNSASLTVSFLLDLTAPTVSLSGVASGAYANRPVTLTFSGSDANLATITATLDGAPFTSGSVVHTPGAHTLVATATDVAGNVAQATRSFTLDFTAPVIQLSGVSEGAAGLSFTPAFSATDASPVTVGATLDGAPFPSGTVVNAPGAHTLILTATDAAGNVTTRTVSFTVKPNRSPRFAYAACAFGKLTVQNSAAVRGPLQNGAYRAASIAAHGTLAMKNSATVTGDVVSGGNASFINQTSVSGKAYHGGSYEKANAATVAGGHQQLSLAPQPCECGYPLATVLADAKTTNDNGLLSADPAIASKLVNGALVVTNGTITLPGGDFYLKKIQVSGAGTVLVAAGKRARLFIEGDIEVRNSGSLSANAAGASLLLISGANSAQGGVVDIRNASVARMSVYAPLANLSLANAATLEGSVVAKDITLSNAQVLSFEGPQSSPPALTCE